MKNVAIIGNHGSGQTTAATALQLCCGYTYIAPMRSQPWGPRDPWGHVARARLARDPEDDAQYFCAAMADVLKGATQPFVLDGFPRTIAQWVHLEAVVSEPIKYVYMVAPQYLCLRRLLRRPLVEPDEIAKQFALFETGVLPLTSALERCSWIHNSGRVETDPPDIAHIVERLKLIAEVGS